MKIFVTNYAVTFNNVCKIINQDKSKKIINKRKNFLTIHRVILICL